MSASQGQYQDKPKLPFIPGSEVSGTVIEVGGKVNTCKVGDKVSSSHLGCLTGRPEADACQHRALVTLDRPSAWQCAANFPTPAGDSLQVCAVTRGGAFAEEVVVPAGAVLKLPSGVDVITAAGAQGAPPPGSSLLHGRSLAFRRMSCHTSIVGDEHVALHCLSYQHTAIV